jgi:phosphoglycolate phosphatase
MIANILFDLDGTLLDPKKGITGCIRFALKKLGRSPWRESDLTQFIGPPLRQTFATILSTSDKALIEKAVYFYRERFAKIGLFENEIYAGVTELLEFLHNQPLRLYIATAKPKIFAEKIVRHFKLNHYFEEVFGPDLEGRFDHKDQLIEFILLELSLRPEDTIMIGDRREDIIAGKANGTRTIGVTYGYGNQEEIQASKPDYICHHPAEIQKSIMMSFAN